MPSSAFLLILLSSLMHAGWNLILKTARHKLAFNVFMHGSAIAVFSAYLVLFRGGIPLPTGRVLAFTVAGGFLFSLYHFCLTAAYDRVDVSVAYPLTTTGPLYIPLWAFLFLGEVPSPVGSAGIAVTFLGAWVLQMREISAAGFLAPLRSARNPGILLALAAGLFYSFGAVVDKRGVSTIDVILYTYYLDVMLFLFLLANTLLRKGALHFVEEVRARWLRAFAGGLVLFASFITYRFGLRMAHVSYATSTRQASAVFGVLGGILLFGDSFGKIRVAGAVLIAAGVAMIKLG
jgi:drug/metabolite transporter (DMT)-like permease